MPKSVESQFDVVRVKRDRGVALIVLDRPPVNAFDLCACARLEAAFADLAVDRNVHCVILTAPAASPFCAGRDIKELLSLAPDAEPAAAQQMRALFDRLLEHPVPVVAAVNGPALGLGTVLTALCDVRIATPTARFALPEISIGRAGGAAFVARVAMPGAVRRLALTGETIGAEEAVRIGLIDEVMTEETLRDSAWKIARTIASKPPLGIRGVKRGLDAIGGLTPAEGYRVEQSISAELIRTSDSIEAIRALAEKRAPQFTGS
jgi:enoyl-CoA hydratase